MDITTGAMIEKRMKTNGQNEREKNYTQRRKHIYKMKQKWKKIDLNRMYLVTVRWLNAYKISHREWWTEWRKKKKTRRTGEREKMDDVKREEIEWNVVEIFDSERT